MSKRGVVVAVVLAVVCVAPLKAQEALDIRSLTSTAEFKAMGLEKLTPSELQRLNAWLLEFAQRVYQISAGGTTESTPAVVESKIEGDFECWEGDTIFRLLNGQIWQQADYQYKYCYKFMPDVLIYRSGSGYKMKVDGVDGEVSVRRIR